MKKLFLIFAVLLPSVAWAAAPSPWWLAPRIGPAGTVVTVSGEGLCQGTTTVTVGGVSATGITCTTTYPHSYHMSFTVPSGLTSGSKTVAISNDGGTDSTMSFTVRVFVAGNTFYVSPTGSDAANGLIGTPWLSVQHAVDNVSPGDTILLTAGTHNHFLLLDKTHGVNGTLNGPITIKAETTATWIIDPTKTPDVNCRDPNGGGTCGDVHGSGDLFIWAEYKSYYTIGEGITFDHHGPSGLDNWWYGIICKVCTGVIVRGATWNGNDIYTSGGPIIQFNAGAGEGGVDNLAENNVIVNWGRNDGGEHVALSTADDNCGNQPNDLVPLPAYLSDPRCYQPPRIPGQYTVFRNNYVNGTGNGDGVQMSPYAAKYTLVEGNTFVRKHTYEENCADFKQGDYVTFVDNTCSGYRPVSSNANGDAVLTQGDQHNNIYEGNIIYDSGMGMNFGLGCCSSTGQVNIKIAHNLIFGMGKFNLVDTGECCSFGTGLQMNSVTNAEIVNNVIANNAGPALSISGGSNLSFDNNIFYNAERMLQEIGSTPSNRTFGKNIFFNSTGETFLTSAGGVETLAQFQARTSTATGSINSNPLFVNPTTVIGTQDYHLTSSSPGIDFCTAISMVTGPFNGAAPDCGIYEGAGGPTPPVRSNARANGVLTPTTLASGTTSTTISMSTAAAATCKYGVTANVAYASIANTFSGGGTTSHSATASGLSDGTTFTYYVRCNDTNGSNVDDFVIQFTVASSAPTIPSRSNGAPTATQPVGTTQVTISMSTDIVANCHYALTTGVAYASGTAYTTTNATTHSSLLTGLTAGTYNVSSRCQGTGGGTNTTDYTFSFTVLADVPPNQFFWWKFDEASGSTVVDSSGSGNTGTINGGATFVTGHMGNAIQLDGISGYVIKTPAVVPGAMANFTLTAWVKPDAVNPPAFASVFANLFSGATNTSFQIDASGSNPGTWRVNIVSAYAIGTITTDWTLIAITYGTVGNNVTLKTYLQGTLTNTYTLAVGEGRNFSDYVVGINRAGTVYFPGLIDEVRLYDSVLSDANIMTLFTGVEPSFGCVVTLGSGVLKVGSGILTMGACSQ